MCSLILVTYNTVPRLEGGTKYWINFVEDQFVIPSLSRSLRLIDANLFQSAMTLTRITTATSTNLPKPICLINLKK